MLATYGIIPSIQINAIFARHSEQNLVEGKYSIQWFEGESDVSSTSIESVCIYDDEDENIDIEYESDSDTYSASDEE